MVMATDGSRLFTYGGHGFHRAPGIKVFDLKDGRPLNWGNKSPYIPAPEGGSRQSNRVFGLVFYRGTLYASYRDRNMIAAFD